MSLAQINWMKSRESLSLNVSSSDKLDEILAAAQQTISTNEGGPGVRAQGSKRERGRSFYGHEVCLYMSIYIERDTCMVWCIMCTCSVLYMCIYHCCAIYLYVCGCVCVCVWMFHSKCIMYVSVCLSFQDTRAFPYQHKHRPNLFIARLTPLICMHIHKLSI